jgi:hypothetical protein
MARVLSHFSEMNQCRNLFFQFGLSSFDVPRTSPALAGCSQPFPTLPFSHVTSSPAGSPARAIPELRAEFVVSLCRPHARRCGQKRTAKCPTNFPQRLRQHYGTVEFNPGNRVLVNPQVGTGVEQHGGHGIPSIHVGRGLDLIGMPDGAGDLHSGIGIQLQVRRGYGLSLRVESDVANPVVAAVGDKNHALRKTASGGGIEECNIAWAIGVAR